MLSSAMRPRQAHIQVRCDEWTCATAARPRALRALGSGLGASGALVEASRASRARYGPRPLRGLRYRIDLLEIRSGTDARGQRARPLPRRRRRRGHYRGAVGAEAVTEA